MEGNFLDALLQCPIGGGGGGGGLDATATGFSSFSREWEELLFQTKLLAVVSSYLWDICPPNFFLDRTYCLGSKIRLRECAGGGGGWQPPPHGLFKNMLLTMKMTFNLDKFWYGVR